MGDRATAPPLDRLGVALGDFEIDRLGVRILHPGGSSITAGLQVSALANLKITKIRFSTANNSTHTHLIYTHT